MGFDCNRPFRARDGRPVMIWANRYNLLMGAYRTGNGGYYATCWGADSGLRVDTLEEDGADLVNYEPNYSDEQIEHWANVFQAHRLHEQGIRFDTFITCPQDILVAIERLHTADRLATNGADDLLPAQRAAVDDLEQSLVPATAELRGGSYIEPLRHHAWASSPVAHRNRRVQA